MSHRAGMQARLPVMLAIAPTTDSLVRQFPDFPLVAKFENRPLGPTNYLNPIIELASFQFSEFPQLGSIWVQSTNLRLFAQLPERPRGSNGSKLRG